VPKTGLLVTVEPTLAFDVAALIPPEPVPYALLDSRPRRMFWAFQEL